MLSHEPSPPVCHIPELISPTFAVSFYLFQSRSSCWWSISEFCKISLPPCAIQPSQPTPSLPIAILMPCKQSDSVFNISEQSFNNSLCGSSPLQKKACLHSSADFNLCLTQQSFILILVLSCGPSVNCFTCLSLQVHLLESFVHTFGEGNGTPLQHSCLENPVDGGAW